MARPSRTTVERMSEADYLALGDLKPYREFLDGIVIEKVMGNRDHLDLAHAIDFALGLYALQHGGRSGPEGRVLFRAEGRPYYRIPDVAYWAADRARGPKNAMNPPTLAVEIRSPGESMHDQREKCRFMHGHGADVCWLVDPESRTVEVFAGDAPHTLRTGAVLESPFLPGFALAVAELFAVLDD